MSDNGWRAPPPAAIADDDNPEWTEADFARSRPIADFPALAAAFSVGGEPRGIASAKTTVDGVIASARNGSEEEMDA